jgi:hypothetical protein
MANRRRGQTIFDGQKYCRACETWKLVDAFSKRTVSPDGRYDTCRDCFNTARRRARNSSTAYLEYQRKYRKDNVERIQAINHRSYEKHKNDYAKRQIERRALKRTIELKPHLTAFGRRILLSVPTCSHPHGITEHALIVRLHGLDDYTLYVM